MLFSNKLLAAPRGPAEMCNVSKGLASEFTDCHLHSHLIGQHKPHVQAPGISVQRSTFFPQGCVCTCGNKHWLNINLRNHRSCRTRSVHFLWRLQLSTLFCVHVNCTCALAPSHAVNFFPAESMPHHSWYHPTHHLRRGILHVVICGPILGIY